MLSSCPVKTRVASADVTRRYMSANVVRAPAARTQTVVCAAAPATTFDNWSTYIKAARKGAKTPTPDEAVFSQMAVQVASAAKNFTPLHGGGTAGPEAIAAAKKAAAKPAKKAPSSVATDLQKKLDKIGKQRLAEIVGASVDHAAGETYTTTEFGAALSMTSVVVEKGGEKKAVVVFLATESELEKSWSRLQGLILHWAVADKQGGAWSMPSEGWSAIPSKNTDAGGAWNSSFDKTTLEGSNVVAYSLALQLPLKGTLKSGGIIFVLKAAEGQNTRWLKDANTDLDFFLDLQQLPVIHA